MALIQPIVNRNTQGANSIVVAQWLGLGNADTGVPVALTDWADRSIQVSGTFGGATLTVQGSNDYTNYFAQNYSSMVWNTMRDPLGNLLTFSTSGDLKQMLELALYVRVITSGGAGTNLNVVMGGRQLIPLSWS